jgi:hypothetical protein
MNFMAPAGTTADKTTSDVVDAFLFGSAIPDVYDSSRFFTDIQNQMFHLRYTFQMSQPRTRPQLGQLGNRYAVVAAGSTCIEYQPIDPNDPRSQLSQFCCGATNIDIFDLQGASSASHPKQTYRGDLPQQPASTCNFQMVRFVFATEVMRCNPVCSAVRIVACATCPALLWTDGL